MAGGELGTLRYVGALNFKSLADIHVAIDRPTVLVGRNAAGKSAFIDVLRFVRDALRNGLDRATTERQGFEAVRRYSPTRPFHVHIKLNFLRGEMYEIALSSVDGQPVVRSERFTGVGRGGEPIEFEVRMGVVNDLTGVAVPDPQPGSGDLFFRRVPNTRRVELQHIAFYSAYPNTLRVPQKYADTRQLEDDGSNLASVLQKLTPERHRKVRDALQSVVPEVTDFSVQRAGNWLSIILHHGNIQRDAFQESDGTLRALGLATLLFAFGERSGPPLVGIEEPELGIHPGALADLWSLIETASDSRTIIITTHSPDLISRVPLKSLRVVRMESGVTTIGSVAKHQVEALERELFTTGDLLRIGGLDLDPVVSRHADHRSDG